MKYFEEAKYIWKNYVPKSGQADTVQGELLRAVEKLRYEAHNNGNINLDEGFVYFCNYIWDILSNSGSFDELRLKEIRQGLDIMLNFEEPYLNDDLYDSMTDYIIEWYFDHKEPIKREFDPKQFR